MNNYWIFVVTDWTDESGKTWKGREIFHFLKKDKIWGIGDRTNNRKRLSSGDKVAFYLAGTEGKRFLGIGELNSECKPFKHENVDYSEETNKIITGWGNAVTFSYIEEFEQPKPLAELTDSLDFIIRKDIAANYFMNGTRSITKRDFEIIESGITPTILKEDEMVEDKSQFFLEKYLQDFIIDNWNRINFDRKLEIYPDENGKKDGQFTTDVGYIDILATDDKGNFVVIELKKGKESDKVVGQILRYIGWVKKNLAKQNQKVEGIIICKENDEKMEYAISAINGVTIKHYEVDFKLK